MSTDKEIRRMFSVAFIGGSMMVSFGVAYLSPACGLIVAGLILMFVSGVAVRNG